MQAYMETIQRRLCKAGCLMFLASVGAYGQSIYENSVSARATSVAGAVVASPEHPLDVMTTNPAGLASVSSRDLEIGYMSVFAQGHFSNVANSNGTISAFAAGVPYGAFTTPLGRSRFKLGLAITPEMSMAAKWRYTDAPGGIGGTSFGLQDNKSAILALRSAVGLGFFATPKFSIGATLGVVYNSNTLQTAYVFQSQPVLKGIKTLVDLHTRGAGLNGNIGLLFHPSPKLQFGLAYKTRTVIHSHGDISGNAAAQFTTLGAPFRPDFHYDAQVDNVFPQMITGGLQWQFQKRVRLVAQADWVNWDKAFVNLPLTLTHGNNADINALVGSSSLKDFVPLLWHNQMIGRFGMETLVTERVGIRAGYSFASNPVPSTTLTPLTAAIMRHTVATGIGYNRHRYELDATYQYQLPTSAHVSQSMLQAGEYNNSSVRVGFQMLSVTTLVHF